MKRSLLVAALGLALCATGAQAQSGSHVLIVSGSGGEPRFVDAFQQWGLAMVDAARQRFGLPRENVVYLAERADADPAGRINGRSTRENVERELRAIAGRAGADDAVLVLLIGHGSFDDRGARINLPGPDISAVELAELLALLPTQRVAVVNTSSSSGAFQEPLAGANRLIVTATRSGAERNETMFGRFFVQAFSEEGADTDKDGRVSIAEAFEFAKVEVERAYRTANLVQTENARMEGDPDLARTFALRGLPEEGTEFPAELRSLFGERARLETEIEGLRSRRATLEPAAYEAELERLLLELARVNRDIRQRGGGV